MLVAHIVATTQINQKSLVIVIGSRITKGIAMRKPQLVLIYAAALVLALSFASFGQSKRQPRKPTLTPVQPAPEPSSTPPAPASDPTPPATAPDNETLKIDTNLVTVPVIVTDRTGHYLPDVRQDELSIFEDGVRQQVAFFHKVSAPFHVVLMLDTSASTEDKLRQIQSAATAFVEQLQPADRVMIISFDDQVREQNEFTNDRAQLRAAIAKTRPGQGTKLYDAFGQALDSVRKISGRKAIVVFTDGVDMRSDQATYDGTLRGLDEEGVIVYPIRYDTRVETERMLRAQDENAGPQLPTIGVIRRAPPGTTGTTFPSDDPDSVPTRGTKPGGGILGLPSPAEISAEIRRSRRNDPQNDPGRSPGDEPGPPRNRRNDPQGPTDPTIPGSPDPPANKPSDPISFPGDRRRTGRREDDSLSRTLDLEYLTGDSYLKALAEKSGGRLLRADTLGSLPEAFAQIAAELRTQYSIGYYPTNTTHDGLYRAIKVRTDRKDAAVRAKPGYRAPTGQ
jgi:hypothetical protein